MTVITSGVKPLAPKPGGSAAASNTYCEKRNIELIKCIRQLAGCFMALRIGADIGGTFTDLIVSSDDGSIFHATKVLTTPDRPDDAVVAGTGELLKEAGQSGDGVQQFLHGTTLFTNALIERKGARTALVTTRGFRDAIDIAREHRFEMYDLRLQRPEPLAPRPLRFEVDERVLADGSVLVALQDDDIDRVVAALRESGAQAVAVCLINAFLNPAHEHRIRDRLHERLPDLAVTTSSDLVPEIREYERTSTTLANVYVQRIAEEYLLRLQRRLAANGVAGRLLVMQSNGGLCEADVAARFPIRLVESGPAAGAIAAAYSGRLLGYPNLLSFDMGGTTAKACVILDGEPLIAPQFEVDRRYHFKKGSGLPIKIPVVEMIEIGTGGGSIAEVDGLKRLRVGPRSAGSKPGPACYGLGGRQPTVTDADLVLGYLDAGFFLGGKMSLSREAAAAAIDVAVGAPLGLDTVAAAAGIHRLANESMASAARIHAVERACDVERFPIFAFGGAGPVHAYGVARILGSPSVIYPPAAGVMSAIGFLVAPMSFDFVRSYPGRLGNLDWAAVRDLVAQMETGGTAMVGSSAADGQVVHQRSVDMRYQKQGFEVRVPLPEGRLDAAAVDAIRANFEDVYRRLYGHLVPDAEIECVSWRVVTLGAVPNVNLPKSNASCATTDAARKGARQVYLLDNRRLEEVPVYDRYRLAAGVRLQGPAIVEEVESTVVVAGPAELEVDAFGNLTARLH